MAAPTRRSQSEAAELESLGACPHCGSALSGRPNRCPHCGKLLGDAAHDLKRVAADERRLLLRRKNVADALFLLGLAGGGPLISFAGRARLGLFVLLAGASASVLYRYARSSLAAALLIGGLGAAVIAVAVTDPVEADGEDTQVAEAARAAYVEALGRTVEQAGGLVEARGPGLLTVWFEPPTEVGAGCGGYPEAATRAHLAELGFMRVVVATRTEGAGVCSFEP